MKRLRIATLFTELGIGGDENRALTFAREVDKSRFEPLVVTLVSSDADGERRVGPMAARYREAGIPLESLGERRRADCRPLPQPLSALRDGGRILRIAARLARLFRRERIDVVDARMTYNMVVGLAAARLAGVPVAIATEYYVDFWSTRPWRFIAPAVFDGFDAVISDSNWALDRYRADLGRPLAHGVVVPNGVAAPHTTRSRAEMRRALGLAEGACVIGQVARVIRYKGQRQLVRAAADVLRREPNVWLLLCGYDASDPEYGASVRDEIRALGIGDRTRMIAWPGPIAEVWRAIDVHAHPSLLDSSPLAIHESMALGLPAVVSSAGGIPELVQHDVTGLVVPPDDTAALAAALTRVVREPQLAARLGAAARRRYQARHRPEQMTRAIEDLIVARYADKRRAGRTVDAGVALAAGG